MRKKFSFAKCFATLLALTCMWQSNAAYAFALGRLSIQSALGEMVAAEIEVPEITQEEANTLRLAIGSVDTFKLSGLEYSPFLSALVITPKQRTNGQVYLEVRSTKAVTEPFLDLVLEVSWSTGKIVRDYTLLFDPPKSSPTTQTLATPSTLPSVGGSTATSATEPTPLAPSTNAIGTSTTQPLLAPSIPKSLSAKTPGISPSVKTSVAIAKDKNPGKPNEKITTKKGDTAGELAADTKPDGISLDQMLLALLKSNPQAFEDNNINRLKSGVVLDIPDEQSARASTPAQAKQVIAAQARDFQIFKQNLARTGVGSVGAQLARESKGNVTAKVTDSKSAAPADKLTLSKPNSLQAGNPNAANNNEAGKVKGSAEDKIASERNARETAARSAELNKNLTDLGKIAANIGGGKLPSNATSGTPSNSPVLVPLPAPSLTTPVAPASAVVSTSAAISAPASSAAAAPTAAAISATTSAPSETASAAAKPNSSSAPAASDESSLSNLLNRPELPYAAGGLLLALLAYAVYRIRQNRNDPNDPDSSHFVDSKVAPDSFFGAGGGQKIDTKETRLGGASSSYSLSQLDATGDVDPVAEADVYLAYNRDVQAEEILKEAKNNTPHRTAIYVKLLEIYLKRRDLKAFDATTHSLHAVCKGQGPEWENAKALAREMNFSNSLFSQSENNDTTHSNFSKNSKSSSLLPTLTASSANAQEPSARPIMPNKARVDPVKFAASTLPSPMSTLESRSPAGDSSSGDAGADKSMAMIEFDLSSFTLDLPSSSPVGFESIGSPSASPTGLDVKLSLAEEYLSMGDRQGAATLLNEVIEKGTPAQATKAQQLLSH